VPFFIDSMRGLRWLDELERRSDTGERATSHGLAGEYSREKRLYVQTDSSGRPPLESYPANANNTEAFTIGSRRYREPR
jgi:hypothetical protein